MPNKILSKNRFKFLSYQAYYYEFNLNYNKNNTEKKAFHDNSYIKISFLTEDKIVHQLSSKFNENIEYPILRDITKDGENDLLFIVDKPVISNFLHIMIEYIYQKILS